MIFDIGSFILGFFAGVAFIILYLIIENLNEKVKAVKNE